MFLKTQMTDKYIHSNTFPCHTSQTQSIPCAFPPPQSKGMSVLCLTTAFKNYHNHFSFGAFFFPLETNRQTDWLADLLRDQNIFWRRKLRWCWQAASWLSVEKECGGVICHSHKRCTGEHGTGRYLVQHGTGAWLLLSPAWATVSSALLGSLGQQVGSQLLSAFGSEISSSLFSWDNLSREQVEVPAKAFMPRSKSLLRKQSSNWELGSSFMQKERKEHDLVL